MPNSQNQTNNDTTKFNQKQIFIRDASPDNWLSYSEELADAAECLWLDNDKSMMINVVVQPEEKKIAYQKFCGHSRSYILLAGLALENVLKATLIARDVSLIRDGRIADSIKSHKLIALANMIEDLDLSENDSRIMQICQDAIPYWGRYPVPLTYGGVTAEEATTPEFRDCFRKLHYRLCKGVYDLIKNGWDSGAGPQTHKVRSTRYGDPIDTKESLLWIK